MRELMVMETTRQLSLFQVGCNVLVWHLLEASLEKVDLLEGWVSTCSRRLGGSGCTSSSFQALPPPVEDFLFF
jgi:hypothetical protein